MHFGRVDDISAIAWALPADAPRTQAFLRLAWGGAGVLHVGAPIWNCDAWVGSLYPDGTPSAGYLEAYAAQLGAVELNSSFYHLLDAPRLAAWAARVPPGFKFCPKVFRGITEALGAADLPALVQRCAAGFAGLGDRYGLGFAQFPESFAPLQAPLLKRFLELWPRALPLAVELRHPGWFQETGAALRDEAVNLLYRHGAATVITDTAGRRDVLHTSLTQPRVMVRFQGCDLDPTDQARLGDWAGRLVDWAGRGLEDLYFFCHQPTEALIPKTVNVALRALQMRGVMEPAPWRSRAPTPPRPARAGNGRQAAL
jgi:uncharacterized protein YecE (DUF72 family)